MNPKQKQQTQLMLIQSGVGLVGLGILVGIVIVAQISLTSVEQSVVGMKGTLSEMNNVLSDSQLDEGLLVASGADERVDLLALDVVHLLHGAADLGLVRADVHDEHERVVLLNLLHGRLGGERVLEDLEL